MMNGSIKIKIEGIEFIAYKNLDRTKGESDMEKALKALKYAGIELVATDYGYID